MHLCNSNFYQIIVTCVYVCVHGYVSVGHLDVWGELTSRKRSLTHCPSSQGWASRYVGVYGSQILCRIIVLAEIIMNAL